MLVGHGEAPDVEALGPGVALDMTVDATEHERRLAEIEVGKTLEQGLVERVALETGLEGSSEIGLVEITQTPGGLSTLLEALVGVIDVGLLVGEIRVVLRHRNQ